MFSGTRIKYHDFHHGQVFLAAPDVLTEVRLVRSTFFIYFSYS